MPSAGLKRDLGTRLLAVIESNVVIFARSDLCLVSLFILAKVVRTLFFFPAGAYTATAPLEGAACWVARFTPSSQQDRFPSLAPTKYALVHVTKSIRYAVVVVVYPRSNILGLFFLM